MNEPVLKNLITKYEAYEDYVKKHPDRKENVEKHFQRIERDIIEYVTSERFKEALKYFEYLTCIKYS